MQTQIFDEYSRFYDLLYQDKDYTAEAQYVVDSLRCQVVNLESVLEFGSGTGRHGRLIASKGIAVRGIERSESMVQAANRREEASDIRFDCVVGDIRNSRVPGQFDAVTSLFHVVSYQTADDDIDGVFANAGAHLRPGGVFLFDVWYAPAVLTVKPDVRVKRVEDDQIHLTRIAEPTLHSERNCVQVDYTLFVCDKSSEAIRTVSETHWMRYFSTPEIRMLANWHGFDLVVAEEWLTGNAPSVETWGVCYVLKKRVR